MYLTVVYCLQKRQNMCYNNNMNGYDFDGTILRGNCMRKFALFCTLRLPYLLIFTPVLLVALILRAVHILNKNSYLFMLAWFIALVPHADKFAVKFWDKNIKHIKSWYIVARRDDDVIVSASPYFLVNEACRRLGVKCIATDLDTHAKLRGRHCHGKYKVKYFTEQYPDVKLATYYSDSYSDTPMWKFADRGYLVKGNKIRLVYQDGHKVK